MGHLVAVAGKGGTGKTTITALLVRILLEDKKGGILAIDADPNSNLGLNLGVKVTSTVSSLLDRISTHPELIPAGMSKDRFMEFELQNAILEADGFDLLTMGTPEGPGCYCYVNNVLRDIMGRLLKDYDFVIVDNEAGLEHFSRRTTRFADTLLVIAEPTQVGLQSARRINELVLELKIPVKNKFLLLNRCLHKVDTSSVKNIGLECIGTLPYDEKIVTLSEKGDSLFELANDSVVLSFLRKIGDRIW